MSQANMENKLSLTKSNLILKTANILQVGEKNP